MVKLVICEFISGGNLLCAGFQCAMDQCSSSMDSNCSDRHSAHSMSTAIDSPSIREANNNNLLKSVSSPPSSPPFHNIAHQNFSSAVLAAHHQHQQQQTRNIISSGLSPLGKSPTPHHLYMQSMNRHSPGSSPSMVGNTGATHTSSTSQPSPGSRHMDLPSPSDMRNAMARDRAAGEGLMMGSNGGGLPGMGALGLSQHHHQLSPNSQRDAGALNSLVQSRIGHLAPHGLGLFNQMIHHGANPLELMAAAHHHHQSQAGMPRSSSQSSYMNSSNQSPPPISNNDPTVNECKLVDYRGQKVAAFIIAGETMLCLPQAFELFLKHLVGGLHTVYTKLKRLDIVPIVCNVEQVRILRGLGAIQPGVNRCKLLSCKDFDVLYRDCTTARYVSGKRDWCIN